MLRLRRNSQDLWIDVSRGFLINSLVGGPFDEFALLEPGASTDKGDQVWGVDRTPALLGRSLTFDFGTTLLRT